MSLPQKLIEINIIKKLIRDSLRVLGKVHYRRTSVVYDFPFATSPEDKVFTIYYKGAYTEVYYVYTHRVYLAFDGESLVRYKIDRRIRNQTFSLSDPGIVLKLAVYFKKQFKIKRKLCPNK